MGGRTEGEDVQVRISIHLGDVVDNPRPADRVFQRQCTNLCQLKRGVFPKR
jgi:hypothetical protein